ncbi:MAG: YibE/F family protein [Nitriliruptoraceae bacterium]
MIDLGTRTHRRLLVVVALVLVATIAGLIALWPSAADLPERDAPVGDVVAAEVRAVQVIPGDVDPITGSRGDIALLSLWLMDGDDQGEIVNLEVFADGYPEFEEGDQVTLALVQVGEDTFEYYVNDFQRTPVLRLLVGIFIAAVLLVSRWHGLRALIGLGASLLIVVQFIVPAILAGSSPPLVALVGAMAVMIVTLYMTHGLNEMTTAAVIGTAASLILTIGLALVFIGEGKITGFASDDAVFARFAIEGLDLQGLVLAGLIIAALGVLDDVTVSQASTVFALHDANRRLTWGSLFARAMKVGRDHIASVVNTLFLAYAGASLALLVLFSTSGLPLAEIINSEVLAEEIVKTVVGSLGLIAAVPFTTALAVTVAVRRSPDAPTAGRGHTPGRGPSPTLGARGTGSVQPPARDRSVAPAARRRPESAGHDPSAPSALDQTDEQEYRSWLDHLRKEVDAPRPGEEARDPDQPTGTSGDPHASGSDGSEGGDESGGSRPTR